MNLFIFFLFLLCIMLYALIKSKKCYANEERAHIKNFSPKEALEELMAGNKRYVSDESIHFEENAIRRQHTAMHGQFPIATVLACSDSRMPVETLLDQGNGEIFVIRIAGNIVGDQVLGSIDYSVINLAIPLILVLGHTQCGAIYAAVDDIHAKKPFTKNEEKLLTPILPSIKKRLNNLEDPSPEELIEVKESLIVKNVWKEISEIIRSSDAVREGILQKRLMVVGAVYNIQTGEVEWLGRYKGEVRILAEYK